MMARGKTRLTRIFGAIACVAAVTLAATASPTQPAAEGDAIHTILTILDDLSPSNPDTKNLAALFQKRAAVEDARTRSSLDDFAALGFIAAKRQDLYRRHVRPVMEDPTRIEGEILVDCQACAGNGNTIVKCLRCGGTGSCQMCFGSGKRRIDESTHTLRGPMSVNNTPSRRRRELDENEKLAPDMIRYLPCASCKKTGSCQECGGTGTKKLTCQRCAGSGKVFSPSAVNRLVFETYDTLRAAIKLKAFETSIPESIATANADDAKFFAPVFTFGARRVAALPARALIGISRLTLFTRDKRPIPFSYILVSANRDLALVDLADSSIMPPLELAKDASQLDSGCLIYAYGTSRENDMAVHMNGKVRATGPDHIATTLDSRTLSDCAALVTDSGKLGGLLMFPMAQTSASGAVNIVQDNGLALRLDNILPSDFTSVSMADLNLRNTALTSAKRAIKTAEELLSYDDQNLALRLAAVSEAKHRLERSIAMLKANPKWKLFLMEATANGLMADCETCASNLERRQNGIAAMETAPRNTKEQAPQPQKEDASGAVASPKHADNPGRPNIAVIIKFVICPIVAITVLFLLIGLIQDWQRKKKLSVPQQTPDFIMEMQEYEREHPEKPKERSESQAVTGPQMEKAASRITGKLSRGGRSRVDL